MELSFQLLDESDSHVGSLRRGNILVEPGNMLLIYLPGSTLLSECLPYSPFKDTKISVIERVQHIKKIKVQSTTMSTACGIHILWDGDEIMIEGKPIKVSDSISHIIDRTFDDFANGGMQFSWSSRQRQKREGLLELRRESILIEPGKMWLIYLPAHTLLSECLPYSLFKDTKTSVLKNVKHVKVSFLGRREKHNYDRGVPISSCGVHVLWDQDENMVEQNLIEKSLILFHIVCREPVSARTNIVGSEDWEEEELANISETEDMEEKYITSLSLVSESFRTLAFQ
ncbi:hypothetical protein FEM48_Zijuj05G0176600 [Ziziphus jujuba var. spinosa]|uniref:TMV resistance protein N-like n=1 Tax=Ziziphus jujuba var. spinosa TaxID=714518 RepID=A0A978VG77_ZIZJJ|nr:hypothetical protein FEM48_Zijuj05G0176600 [Ziziphus jujuba var. spinosa]